MAMPLAVFDLDGTLADSAPDLLASLDATLKLHGFPPLGDSGTRAGIGHGARHLIEHGLKTHGLAVDIAQLDRMHRDFLVHYEANICVASRLYPGTMAMLDRLDSAGWTLAVCTNKTEALSRRLLRALGIAERFSAICGGDTFAAPKPDPVHLLGTIDAAGGRAPHSVMIGDSATDLDAARNAGVPFVGMSYGYTPVAMAQLQPDVLLDSLDALTPPVLARLLDRAPHETNRHASQFVLP